MKNHISKDIVIYLITHPGFMPILSRFFTYFNINSRAFKRFNLSDLSLVTSTWLLQRIFSALKLGTIQIYSVQPFLYISVARF